MDYNEQEQYRFNNQHPWKIDDTEIAYILADDMYVHEANKIPYKCWIPTLMGPKQTPKPEIFINPLDDSIYCNDTPCKPPVSKVIQTQNYISVGQHDHDFYYHRWLMHGAEIRIQNTNDDILELDVDTRLDPSFCFSCLAEHPSCNPTHPCTSGYVKRRY